MFASGYFSLMVFITPLPTTWFGRQANGCTQTMFGMSCSIYSIISAVKNHPSPVWLPIDKTGKNGGSVIVDIVMQLEDDYNFKLSFDKNVLELAPEQ